MAAPALEHLAPRVGSLVTDIDLAAPDLGARFGGFLRAALQDRQVLFFRDQHLDPGQLVALAGVFGSVPPVSSTFPSHPDNPDVEILKSAGRRTGTDVWHADLSWQAEPPKGACLLAVDVPPVGGDTMWSSMTAAWDSLDEELRAYLRPMRAIHDWETPELLASIRSRPDAEARYAEMRRAYPPIERPVVIVHPESGREVLNVNALYTTRLVGHGRVESTSLLSFLTGLAAVPEWQVRFRWRPGSIAIWDNLAVQHYAINDYHPYPRLMHRVTIR